MKPITNKKNIHLIPGHLLCNCRKTLSDENEEEEDKRNVETFEDTEFEKKFDLTLA